MIDIDVIIFIKNIHKFKYVLIFKIRIFKIGIQMISVYVFISGIQDMCKNRESVDDIAVKGIFLSEAIRLKNL